MLIMTNFSFILNLILDLMVIVIKISREIRHTTTSQQQSPVG